MSAVSSLLSRGLAKLVGVVVSIVCSARLVVSVVVGAPPQPAPSMTKATNNSRYTASPLFHIVRIPFCWASSLPVLNPIGPRSSPTCNARRPGDAARPNNNSPPLRRAERTIPAPTGHAIRSLPEAPGTTTPANGGTCVSRRGRRPVRKPFRANPLHHRIKATARAATADRPGAGSGKSAADSVTFRKQSGRSTA